MPGVNRRNFGWSAGAFALCFLLLPLGGCTPGSTVVWNVLPAPGAPTIARDMNHLRGIVVELGYVKAEAVSGSKIEGEFFYFEREQRLNVALLPQKTGIIRFILTEIGGKRMSILGLQQAALIADGLVREFGRDRVLQD